MPKRRAIVRNPISEDGNWTPPRGYHGHFLPQNEWNPDELREVADRIDAGTTGVKKGRKKGRNRPSMPSGYADMYGPASGTAPVYPAGDMQEAAQELMAACRAARKLLGYEKNPIEALAIINPRRRLAKRGGGGSLFVKTIDYIKEHPVIILFGVGFLVALFVAIRQGLIRGVPFVSGRGTVVVMNSVATPRSGAPYQITSTDRLWMARMLWGEVGRSDSAWQSGETQEGGAAVLWAMVNHYLTVGRKRDIYDSLGSFLQAYSQPISSRWADPGSDACRSNEAACSSDRTAFRQATRARSWSSFPINLRNLIDRFVAGQLHNPIGTRTDFRASGTGYFPSDTLTVAGNVFGTNPQARLG